MTKIEHIECYGKGLEVWYFPKDLGNKGEIERVTRWAVLPLPVKE